MRLSPTEFGELVQGALRDIPKALVDYMDDLVVDVAFVPDACACEEAEGEEREDLLGLYHGTPLTHRSVEHSGHVPDRITIYQRNIERFCNTRKQLIRQIRKTVFHEIGHHFGLDEEDLLDLGYQ